MLVLMFVVKFGGSLIDCARDVVSDLADYADRSKQCILLVPGGGIFADMVRNVDARMHLSSDASHWMALLAMEQYGLLLCDGTGASSVRGKPDGNGVFVLLPYHLFCMEDRMEQHSWDVTGDTIAAWIANKYKYNFIKATDVQGIYIKEDVVEEICASKLSGLDTCVDRALPGFLLTNGLTCRVVCGLRAEPIITAIEQDRGGTLIKNC